MKFTQTDIDTLTLIHSAMNVVALPEVYAVNSSKEAAKYIKGQINTIRTPQENYLLHAIQKHFEHEALPMSEKEEWSSRRQVNPEKGEF